MSNTVIKKSYSIFNFGWIYPILAIVTAMIGYRIHSSIFWSIMDFIFWPIAWCKWLIFHEVNLSLIKQTFEFFFK